MPLVPPDLLKLLALAELVLLEVRELGSPGPPPREQLHLPLLLPS